MKRLLTLLLLFLSLSCSAAYILFYYDNAGNMIKRSPDGVKKAPGNDGTDKGIGQLAADAVKVYPNPTDGPVTIEIMMPMASYEGQIEVFSISGQFVLREKVREPKTCIDLSNAASGLYVINLIVDEKESLIKILKK